ncbi:unnamed protein product [Penicillium salamii]|uniref:Uncharacterized protein n=1 Tax=Penicillium salamii TaxID=1612424 RepID=A0A9W4N9S0_9EURO|nr:unnamed protein product [Penicillium salamii]
MSLEFHLSDHVAYLLAESAHPVVPTQSLLTKKELPSQQGRVFIVTGSNSGVGFELCKILYGSGATIYMASRSKASSESLAP